MATSRRSSTQSRSQRSVTGAAARSQASRSERSGSRKRTDEAVSRSMGGQSRSGGRQNEGMYGADWDDRGNLSSNAKRDYQDNRSYGYSDHDDREEDRRFSTRGQSERYDEDYEADRYSARAQGRVADDDDDRRSSERFSNFRDEDEDGFRSYNPDERSERSPSRRARKPSQSRSTSQR